MNKLHKRRLYYIIFSAIGLTLAASFILFSLKQNINVFLTPSQISTVNSDYHFRLGGMVKKNSVVREKSGLGVSFIVTDLKKEISVHYIGILPDLFHEGKGVITEGRIDQQGIFQASQVLAKHDENYMPKNVYQVLRENKEGSSLIKTGLPRPAKRAGLAMTTSKALRENNHAA